MRGREFITVLGGAAAAWPVAARAQQGAAKRIGVLMPETEGAADTNAQVVVFENTLKQLGWVPGRNLCERFRRQDQSRGTLAAEPEHSTRAARVAVMGQPD
jgi:hypothetical protein